MAREITTALDTLLALKKRADERAQQLMEEIVELEEYSTRLDPIIEMVEKMPDLGTMILPTVSGPPERREKKHRAASGASATKERIYSVLRVEQLTVTEIARKVGMNVGYVSTLIKEDVDAGVLEKYKRFDDRLTVRILSDEVRRDKDLRVEA